VVLGGAAGASEPWDVALVRRANSGELVRVAREGRLIREVDGRPYRLDLSWVDEAAIALADAAATRNRGLSLVYPAPAGHLGVLLAAQIALGSVLGRHSHRRIGILTGDPAGASRLWADLRLGSPGQRVPLTESFRAWRADPSGRAPMGRRPFSGVLVGRRWGDWPTPITIVDHLSGPVEGTPTGTVLRLFADPLDRELSDLAQRDELIWGWSDSIISLWHDELESAAPGTIPFSVAHGRLANMAAGVSLDVVVVQQDEASRAIERLRDDLRTLSAVAGPTPPYHMELGLRTAWSHAYTLSGLPCRPTQYDEFAGVPPRAARATSSFVPEMLAWARSLTGDVREYVELVASDLADLRAALDASNPLQGAISGELTVQTSALGVMRTRTAALAFATHARWPVAGRTAFENGRARVTWYGRLARSDSWPTAAVVGAPARSAWHRVESGLARRLAVLVIGDQEAERAQRSYSELRRARADLASLPRRERVWRELIDDSPPNAPLDVPYETRAVAVTELPVANVPDDPFSPLGSLLRDERPLLDDEGSAERIARTDGDGWSTLVEAVEVDTNEGRILLGCDDEVDVLTNAADPATILARDLQRGMRLVIGREQGRVGLLEALESSLQHRQDILVARLLIRDYRDRLRDAFGAGGRDVRALTDALRKLGCTKTEQTIRTWVTVGGPMAPRDYEDLLRLSTALGLDLSSQRHREVFGGLTRVRVFRRAAGRALAQAALTAISTLDDIRIDPETGLSVADLRDAVVVSTVESVRLLPEPVRLADTGRLLS
jgi:hypothetical protein